MDNKRRLNKFEIEKYKKVKSQVKKGDRVSCTKCPGTRRTFTFDCWDGFWMVSKSGIDDYAPTSVIEINGILI